MSANLERLVILAVPGICVALLQINFYLALGVPALLLVAGLVWRRLSWKQIFLVYLGVLFLIPSGFYRLRFSLPFDLQFGRVVFLLIVALWSASLLVDPKSRLSFGRGGAAVLAFLAAMALSQLVNFPGHDGEWFDDAAKRFFYLVGFVISFFFIASVFQKKDVRPILKWIVGFGAVVGFFGVIERLAGFNFFQALADAIPIFERTESGLRSHAIYRGGLRIIASSEHPIALSTMMAMIIPPAIHFWLTAKNTAERTFYYVAVAVMSAALIFTASRSGVLMLLAGLLVWFALRPGDIRAYLPHLLLLLLALQLLHPQSLSALNSFFFPREGFLNEGSVNARIVDYPLLSKRFSRAPLVGVGFDMFEPASFFYVDNQYLKLAVETGVIGLAALLWMLAVIAYHLQRAVVKDHDAAGGLAAALLAAIVGFILVSAFYDSFGFHQARSLFFILSALGLKLVGNQKKGELGAVD